MLTRTIILLFIILNLTIYASNITPIPEEIDYNLKKAQLGKKLFNDKRLSINNTISCASCHNIKNGGDDNLVLPFGVNKAIGKVNAPTVLNSVFNFRQFWDGRAKNLEEQAIGPIENPIEMGHTFPDLIKKLNKTVYKEEFLRIYDDGITKRNIVNAIAEFEKTLITPNSRFDQFLKGDLKAITKYEKEGYELFKDKGCITCHHGVNVGGNLYNKFGIIFDARSKNLGRYNLTKNEEDKYFFKVPTLRNIEYTAPYFHDGRYYELSQTVKEMALVQLGRPMKKDEIDKIVAFLKTLTGELMIIE
ncbi:cytochrome-c peroxidase [Arcobacter sp. LA11]|uniref:cytochrome-c peroxidase n=1 Tax=Arcobacter sp. LA11 TaxID=1898176 RepID=UPI000933B269|nr:cytochrome-c peroxidase [Arcobacter sp. LA11]